MSVSKLYDHDNVESCKLHVAKSGNITKLLNEPCINSITNECSKNRKQYHHKLIKVN